MSTHLQTPPKTYNTEPFKKVLLTNLDGNARNNVLRLISYDWRDDSGMVAHVTSNMCHQQRDISHRFIAITPEEAKEIITANIGVLAKQLPNKVKEFTAQLQEEIDVLKRLNDVL